MVKLKGEIEGTYRDVQGRAGTYCAYVHVGGAAVALDRRGGDQGSGVWQRASIYNLGLLWNDGKPLSPVRAPARDVELAKGRA